MTDDTGGAKVPERIGWDLGTGDTTVRVVTLAHAEAMVRAAFKNGAAEGFRLSAAVADKRAMTVGMAGASRIAHDIRSIAYTWGSASGSWANLPPEGDKMDALVEQIGDAVDIPDAEVRAVLRALAQRQEGRG